MSVCYLCWLLKAALPPCKHNIKWNRTQVVGLEFHCTMETFCNFNNLAYLQSLHILLFNFVFHTWFHLFMGDFRKHFCTWYGHLRTLLQLGRYFQTNCCCMMCGKIFLDYHAFSVWSFQKWSFAIKDKIGDNDFELACFSYTHTHSHTVT